MVFPSSWLGAGASKSYPARFQKQRQTWTTRSELRELSSGIRGNGRPKQERRFDYEIQVFTGHRDLGSNWQNLVFGRFAEAVEVTAVQRGCERWRP